MKLKNNFPGGLKPGKLATSIAVALTVPAWSAQFVYAQDPELEEIVITGSRIVRRDYEANSPIQTIDSAVFEANSGMAIEETLNQLPQFVPAATAYTQLQDGELTDTSPTKTAGAATLSLRGMGSNRSLVLINGRRAMPVNASMAVDMNSIPSAAVQRVEVITGGASSVYGADAIAGVVNFILKDDYEGVDLDMQYGAMENGEAGTTRLSGLFGANTADGRGNVMLGVEYSLRKAVDYKDVEFYRKADEDPTVSGTDSWWSGSFYNIDAANRPQGAAIDAIFNQAAPGVVLRNPAGAIAGRVFWNQSDNTLYTGGATFGNPSPLGPGSTAGVYRYNGEFEKFGIQWRKKDAYGDLEENVPGLKANIPLERYSAFGRATFELMEGITAFGEFSAVETQNTQQWQHNPAVAGWGQYIPHGQGIYAPSLLANGTTNADYLPGGKYGLNCAPTGGCTKSQTFPTPPELTQLLDSRVNPEANWHLNHNLDYPYYDLWPTRTTDTKNRTSNLTFGLEGDLDAIDGGWDIVASHGTSLSSINLIGFAAMQRLREVIQSPNYGKAFTRTGNPEGAGFSAGQATCESGFPIFRAHTDITRDCFVATMPDLQNTAHMRQEYVEANLQGKVMEIPAGEVRFSVGGHWRRNSYYYLRDSLDTQESFLDKTLGTHAANGASGETAVKEVYGELFVPIVNDLPGIQHLNLELGYRYSDYELQGGVDTYKALADWAVTEEVRVRGGYQLATRAPNIGELYAAESLTFSADIGDLCGLNSPSLNSVNSRVNPNAARSRAICEALMGPDGVANFYNPLNPQPSPVALNWFVNSIGNPDVKPEEATTWTVGVVYQPTSDNVWLNGFSGSLDWYNIEIEDMIALESAPAVYNKCLGTDTNPSGSVTHPDCQKIIRNPTSGGAQFTDVTFLNGGQAKVEGVDLQINWSTALSEIGLESIPGTFGIDFTVSTLLSMETQASPTQPVIDWVGSLGPSPGTSFNNGSYDYRTFTSFSYGLDNWNFSLRWRHLPGAVSGQQPIAGANRIAFLPTDSYDVFDFSGTWAINENYLVRFGIENLLDQEPNITGAADNWQGNLPTSGQGKTEAGFYDVLGRRYYLGFRVNF